jgi:hypothetical protein
MLKLFALLQSRQPIGDRSTCSRPRSRRHCRGDVREGNLVTPEPPLETKVQAARPNTKRAQLIGLLERPERASVGEIGERLGWLPHTVRAALTGLRHAGREVRRDKDAEGRSVYRFTPVEASEASDR